MEWDEERVRRVLAHYETQTEEEAVTEDERAFVEGNQTIKDWEVLLMRAVVKEETIQLIEMMPDDCTVEDILYELYLKQKVDKGLQEIREGRVMEHEEVQQRISKWSR